MQKKVFPRIGKNDPYGTPFVFGSSAFSLTIGVTSSDHGHMINHIYIRSNGQVQGGKGT